MSKAKAQRKHAKYRALQRFDLDLSEHDFEEMVRQIQHGEARMIEKQSLRVSVFKVTINGIKMAAVYDKMRKTIATVMPLDWTDDGR